ncbi:hypothetical protein FOZ62_028748 [Perkinsus olseni]|uniref:N-acetyltransferase domain-containing protein n=1 Tax=Perkinsus olseni TaxID=32597 RepID=A0A7J6SUA9_PEROL|nr:hypothetical protein FOZ62_028748 [Perkinsus olseni]
MIVAYICWIQIAVGSTATRGDPESHLAGSPKKEESHHGLSSQLQYRPWKPGDMMLRSEMREVMGGRRFVAFKPEADHAQASLLSIVGYVESQEVNHFLAHMLKLPAKERDTVVYISIVYVVSNERRKGIGKMMLRKALEDVTLNHNPSSTDISTTCHLHARLVNPYNEDALRLYKRLNFTFVTEKYRDYYLLYKFPPSDVVGTSTAAV